MIAIETVQRFRVKDCLFILLFSAICAFGSWIAQKFLIEHHAYVIALFLTTFFLPLTVHFVRKAGTAIFFYLSLAFFGMYINDFGIAGWRKIMIFVVAGILFEFFFLILKLEIKNIQIDIILGTALATASIPFSIGIAISPSMTQAMLVSLSNMILLSFFTGFIGATLSFLLWYHLRKLKPVLKYEYITPEEKNS